MIGGTRRFRDPGGDNGMEQEEALRRFRIGMPALVLGGILMLGHSGLVAADCDPSPCDPTPRSHTIVVTTNGVSCKDAHVSVAKLNVIKWCSADGNLQVFFDSPTPFPKLRQKSPTEWQSGPLEKAEIGKTYKYHVFLNGTEIDPNVIIDH